jgi:FAD/FMN-containing dehydrogenase
VALSSPRTIALYDSARALFNGMLDRRPRLIFRPADTDDLVSAVRWASESDVAIAVRGGGHSVAGHSMPDDGFVIDLSRWRSATVDPERRIAEAEGGCLLMDLDAATAGYGLAAPSGTFVDTGIGGLTLGGGISHIIASDGFGCDALIGAELVTADGRVVDIDGEREPDLLWALRGGGGNFGVVTRLRYQLTPLELMYSGSLSYRGPAVGEVLARLFELDASAPDELVTQAIVFWSDEDGGPIVRVNIDWRGEPDDGDAAIRELREDVVPFQTNLRPMTWLQAQARFTPIPFGLRHYWKGHLVSEASTGLADALITAAEGSGDDGFILVELIHGAAHRIPEESAAFGGRPGGRECHRAQHLAGGRRRRGGRRMGTPRGTVGRALLAVGWRLPQLSRGRSDRRTCRGGLRSGAIRQAPQDQADLGS